MKHINPAFSIYRAPMLSLSLDYQAQQQEHEDLLRYKLQHWIHHPRNINMQNSDTMMIIQNLLPGVKIYDYSETPVMCIIKGIIGQFPFVIETYDYTTQIQVYESLQKLMKGIQDSENNLLYDHLETIYPAWEGKIDEKISLDTLPYHLPELITELSPVPQTYGFKTYAPIIIESKIPSNEEDKNTSIRFNLPENHPYADNPYAWTHADFNAPTVRYEQGDSPEQAYERLCSTEYNLSYHLIDKEHADPKPIEVYNEKKAITPDFLSMLEQNIDYIEYKKPLFTEKQKELPEYNKSFSELAEKYDNDHTNTYKNMEWKNWVEEPYSIDIINSSGKDVINKILPGVAVYSIENKKLKITIILAVDDYVCKVIYEDIENSIECLIKKREKSESIDELEDLYLVNIQKVACKKWTDVLITTFLHSSMIAFSYNENNPSITQYATQGRFQKIPLEINLPNIRRS